LPTENLQAARRKSVRIGALSQRSPSQISMGKMARLLGRTIVNSTASALGDKARDGDGGKLNPQCDSLPRLPSISSRRKHSTGPPACVGSGEAPQAAARAFDKSSSCCPRRPGLARNPGPMQISAGAREGPICPICVPGSLSSRLHRPMTEGRGLKPAKGRHGVGSEQ
jgi:hypothetical protein